MRSKFFTLILFVFAFFQTYAQSGSVRGGIYDASTGEYLPGVTIFAEGTSIGTISDLDGKFNLAVSPGTYNLRFSYISYETIILEGIRVKADEVTLLEEIGLNTSNIQIDEVVVTAQTIRNTENALISLKRKSTNVMDGISAANLKKIGDSDAASSMKRISGVSVEGGKYVYVRGLGDRYTKTMLNGVDVPGLDPDRNSIQMDLFPSNIIDNIIVYKSFSADLPADFTGGVVNIEIKDFPVKKSGSISAGGGYNPSFHFNPEYLTYQGGLTDFLGFDDGTRKIPAKSDVPEFAYALADLNGALGTRYREILNSFNPTMATMQKNSFMDYDFGASYGNQVQKENATVGYNFSLSYKNNTEFYVDAIDARYGMNANPDVYVLETREYQQGSYGVNNVFLSALAGYARKTNYSKVRFYLMHLQNGESKAGVFDFIGSDQGSDFSSIQHTLDYSQRSLTNILIDGNHRLSDSNWELEWKISPTLSVLYDPDVRFTRYKNDDGNIEIGTEVGFPERIWRNLLEVNMANAVHASRNFMFRDRKSKLKIGAAYTFKYRDYSIQTFKLNVRGGDTGNLPLSGDPNELLSDELKWPYQGNINFGTAFENDLSPSNIYQAMVNYGAAYGSVDLPLANNFKVSAGLRIEEFYQQYSGQNQSGSEVLNNDVVLNDFDLFPSLNLNINLSDKQSLRLSYSKTIARPSMKELSYAEIYDPLSGRTFIGGLHADRDPIRGIVYWDGKLKSTDIHNFDLRWEQFSSNGQMLSLSGFYKKFFNPIEVVQFATQTGAFQPRNVGDGEVYGGEFELRQDFAFIAEALSSFGITCNITYTESRIELSNIEYESKVFNARSGQTIDNYRVMAGQAPYIINAGFSFNGGKKGFWENLEAGLYYNVQGTTLQFVGIADRPDIYSLPFHSLNFNSNMNLGKEDRISLGIKVSNILGSEREMVYRSYEASEPYFEFRQPGTSFSLSLGYSFF